MSGYRVATASWASFTIKKLTSLLMSIRYYTAPLRYMVATASRSTAQANFAGTKNCILVAATLSRLCRRRFYQFELGIGYHSDVRNHVKEIEVHHFEGCVGSQRFTAELLYTRSPLWFTVND